MTKLPKISVIIPVKIGTTPTIALNSLKKVKYPKKLIEILIVEGNQPSRQRNEAIKKAGGEIIYFLDDDPFVYPNSLRIIAKDLSDPETGVGEPSLTKHDNKSGNYLNHVIACPDLFFFHVNNFPHNSPVLCFRLSE